MAIKPSPEQQPERVRDFWPRTRRRSIILAILIQIIVTLIAALSLLFAGFAPDSAAFLFVIVAIIASSLGMNLILVQLLLAPLHDVADALTHISGEPNDIIAPNSTARSRQYDGLTPVLQLIYQLSSERDQPHPVDKTDTTLLARALEQTSAGLIIMDENGKIAFASKNAPVSEDKDGGQQLSLIFERDALFTAWLENNHTQLKASKTWLRVPDRIMGDPDRRIFDIVAHYEKASKTPIVMIAFDHTDHYQPEDDQLDFISFAAHELRGPVTVIRGYLDVFREELEQPSADPRERTALLSRLIVSANRLSGYITNILNASRYDRQHLKLSLREYHLAQIYGMIADDMSLRASTQNRLLSIHIPTDLPTVAADPSSLSEVFSNLIDNALKYSNEGGSVDVKAIVEGNNVRVSVTDHGIGMPSNVVSNLFHKFYRSHRSRETVGGTGIGLYISKAIVESHGGIIEVKSEEGKGSVFSFSIPTYMSVATKLAQSDNTNQAIIRSGNEGWIKNHAKYRG